MICLFHGVLSLAETQVWVTVSRESADNRLSAVAESQRGRQVATGFEDSSLAVKELWSAWLCGR